MKLFAAFFAENKILKLYEEACKLTAEQDDIGSFAASIFDELPDLPDDTFTAFNDFIFQLYRDEGFYFDDLPEPPPARSRLEDARYIAKLERHIARLKTGKAKSVLHEAITSCLLVFLKHFPTVVHDKNSKDGSIPFEVSLPETHDDLPTALFEILTWFTTSDLEKYRVAEDIYHQLYRNIYDISGLPYPGREPYLPPGNKKLVEPKDYKGDEPIIDAFFKRTPLRPLFDLSVSSVLPEQTRFEHHWILAGSGHGKTQTLQYLITHDLERVRRGEASIVVIDAQKELLDKIKRLRDFAPGGALQDKLVYIYPDPVCPPALNLFDLSAFGLSELDTRERRVLNNAIEQMYEFVFSSLLGNEFTPNMRTPWRYALRTVMKIPGASILTLKKLLEEGGEDTFAEYIAKLDPVDRDYMLTNYREPNVLKTRKFIVNRIDGLLAVAEFQDMFAQPENRLDLFSELAAGKVILVDTDRDLLQKRTSQLFARYCIGLLNLVARRRADPKAARTPTIVYCDEAHEIFSEDIDDMLNQLRKFNIGLVLSHQNLGQLSRQHAPLRASLESSTSIKFAGGVPADARQLAPLMFTTPDFIARQEKIEGKSTRFAAFIKGLTKHAASFEIPFGTLEALPHMSEQEFRDTVLPRQHERYGRTSPREEAEPSHETQEPVAEAVEAPEAPAPLEAAPEAAEPARKPASSLSDLPDYRPPTADDEDPTNQ